MLVTGYSRVEEIYVMLPTEHQFLLHIVIEITTISQILFCFVLGYWLGTPVGNTVLPEALIYIFRNLGDVEGRSCAELETGEGDGHYQRNIRKLWWRLFADLIQPPNTSMQMAGRCY